MLVRESAISLTQSFKSLTGTEIRGFSRRHRNFLALYVLKVDKTLQMTFFSKKSKTENIQELEP